tara:strand:+ start:147788 stop:148339 length:552 start_codon:yes stop_codon:yes gene_type:complete
MGITPGPNNLIALTTGVNYGFKRALPFTIGVVVGFNLLLAMVGFGIGSLIAENKQMMEILAYVGIGFITYMGYKIATSPTEIKTESDDNPGFMHGLLLQMVNPKAWTACLGGITAFNLAGNASGIILYMIISVFVVLFCVGIWAYAGSKITRFLEDKQKHRIFNVVMGASLMLLAGYLLVMDM